MNFDNLFAVLTVAVAVPLILRAASSDRMSGSRSPPRTSTTGRIFVVVARDAVQDPEWSEVTSRIE